MRSRFTLLSLMKRYSSSNNQRFLLTLSLFLPLLLFSGSNAFSQSCHAEHENCSGLTAAPFNGHFYTPPATWILDKLNSPSQSLIGDPPCSTIDVTYIGFTPEAEAAFQYAIEIWETVLSSPVDITIQATWEVLSPGVLGSAGSNYERNFTNAPTTDYYAASIANQIAGADISPGSFDIFMSFGSTFNWYLGTDGNPAAGEYDFVTVVLHEVGHGLGFASSKSLNTNTGVGSFGLGSGTIPFNYDRFLTLGSFGTDLLDLTGIPLGDAFTGNDVFNNSPLAVSANGGLAPKMYAPAVYAGGSSISHWDEATYPAGNPQSLMSPQVGAGEAIHNPGEMMIGLLEDLGWTICYAITDVPNDLPCAALPIACGQTVSGSTELATFSGIDFTCAGDYADAFYSFEGTPGNLYTITVNGDAYDGILAAYTGLCDGALASLACANEGTSAGIEETISFSLSSSETVLIQTAGWGSTAGAFDLTLSCELINDLPCNAIALNTDGAVSIYSNVGATADIDEAVPPGTSCQDQAGWCAGQANIDNSVWFSFIGPASGRVNVLTCNAGATFDTQLAIYASTDCSDYSTYTLLSANDDVTCGEQLYASSAFACVIPGTEYYVQVDGYNGAAGSIAISISEEESGECDPLVDGCTNALAFGTATLDGTDILVTIATCAFEQEYSVIDNAALGSEYTFSSITAFGQYLTVRSGTSDGPLVGSGFSPLTVTSDIDGQLFLHYNSDELCGTSSGNCVSSTVQCISCALDCPILSGNIGDACDDGNPNTIDDLITAECDCIGTSIFDCPSLSANIGDACDDGNPETNNDTVNGLCECAGNLPCLTSSLFNILTLNGTDEVLVQSGCNLLSEYNEILNAFDGDDYTFTAENGSGGLGYITIRSGSFDGPVLGSGFSPVTVTSDIDGTLYAHYTLNEFCEVSSLGCITTTVQCVSCNYDCPSIPANIGDACDDGNAETENDAVTADCGCLGTSIFDCPLLSANIGDACDDGNAETENDTVTADCGCLGTSIFDCPLLSANIGDACDDGNTETENDVVTADCGCLGTSIFDCPLLSANIGDACDDGDAGTSDDAVTADCNCEGTVIPNAIATLLTLECGGQVIQITGAIGGPTGGGTATSSTRTIYSFAPDAGSAVPTYTGSAWPYVLIATGIDVDPEITAALAFNELGQLSVNGMIAYQFIGDGSPSDASGPGGPWSYFLPNGNESQDACPPPAPANDLCENAETVTVYEPGECPENQITGTTIGASDESGAFSCDGGDFLWPDVFYTFNSGNYNNIQTDIQVISQTDIVIEVTDGCGGISQFCTVGSFNNTIAVSPNTDYTIRIAANTNFGGVGTFTVCLSGVWDCPIFAANIGDACDDGDPNTINDVVTADCICAGELPESGSLSGTADWNNSCGSRSLTMELYEPGTATLLYSYATSIDANGDYNLGGGIAVGNYDIYAKIEGLLANSYLNETIALGANSLSLGSFVTGDIDDNNGININDFSLLNISLGSSNGDVNFNYLADMNCDGFVNIIDFSLLNIGFGMVGAQP